MSADRNDKDTGEHPARISALIRKNRDRILRRRVFRATGQSRQKKGDMVRLLDE